LFVYICIAVGDPILKQGIRLIGLNLTHSCAVPNQDWISICICSDLFVFNDLRGEEVVSFVNIGGITKMY